MSYNNSSDYEEKIRDFWEKERIYKFDPSSGKEIYSFDTPPPTISGRLHMGHAFGDAQQDFFVRFKRMQGYEVLNPFGTDNNGLPTLKLVEKEKNISSKDMKREEFIELCQKTISEKYIPQFLEDVKNIGISADFDLFYSTIDERSRRISQWSFIDLYNKGREYRVESPALWCPKCQTTIAQFELEDKEIESSFNDIVFKIEGKDVIISTTRPEFLPACVSVFINPRDKKNKHLIGKKARVPLYDFEVPVLADDSVDMEKGSGVVMCCTFGDQNDMEWQKFHNLPIKMAIDEKGKMTSLTGKYEGLSIKEAREKIIQDLKSEGLLKGQKKITHSVNVHERCDTEVEFIKKKQWFVKYLDLKDEMFKWATDLKWHPKFMKTRYDNWVEGLKWDWCISRQIPFGIPFPVWYCKNPKCEMPVLAREKDLPVDPVESKPPVDKCPHCGGNDFEPETDVMNTWATSALTPTIIKDLIKEKRKDAYEKIKDKPMSIRRNGQDIITFWDFNTMVKSQLHYGINPWEEVYINGWILGRDGRKMSKSKGNGISPQEIMDEHGADALRYLSASVKPGSNMAFSDKELTLAKKLHTKLSNATKFVFMNLEDYNKKDKPKKFNETDKSFLKELNNTVEKITGYFESYDPSLARDEFERFFWNMFCDNYLEIVKKRVYNSEEGSDEKVSAQYTLYQALLALMKMLAPIMPFVTEEIYQNYFKDIDGEKSIHLASWPKKIEGSGGASGKEDIFSLMVDVISKVRKEKSENRKPMNSEVILSLQKEDYKKLEGVLQDLKNVTNSKEIKVRNNFKVELV